MSNLRLTPEACRSNADVCRDIAVFLSTSEKQQAALKDMARAWEQLAEDLERQAAERRRNMIA